LTKKKKIRHKGFNLCDMTLTNLSVTHDNTMFLNIKIREKEIMTSHLNGTQVKSGHKQFSNDSPP